MSIGTPNCCFSSFESFIIRDASYSCSYKSDDRESLTQDPKKQQHSFPSIGTFRLVFTLLKNKKFTFLVRKQNHLKRARAPRRRGEINIGTVKQWGYKSLRHVYTSCFGDVVGLYISAWVLIVKEKEENIRRASGRTFLWPVSAHVWFEEKGRNQIRDDGIIVSQIYILHDAPGTI